MLFTVRQSKVYPFKVDIMLGPRPIARFEAGMTDSSVKDVDAHNAHELNKDVLPWALRACAGLNEELLKKQLTENSNCSEATACDDCDGRGFTLPDGVMPVPCASCGASPEGSDTDD